MLFLPLTVVRMDSTDLYSNIESALHSHDGSRLVVVQYIYIYFFMAGLVLLLGILVSMKVLV